MRSNDVMSDHGYTWSEIYAKAISIPPKKKARRSAQPAAGPSTPHEGLTYRTFQAMWQGRLQMRDWTGARPQILPVDESARFRPAHGIRSIGPPRQSERVFGQSSPDARNPGRSVPYQSGASTPQRRILIHGLQFASGSIGCACVSARSRKHARDEPSPRSFTKASGETIGGTAT